MVIKASDFYLDLAWDKNADSVTLHIPTDNVGIQTIPTARLHLPAGTTTPYSAPLKFTGGSLLSNLEDGAFEYDGTYLYITSQNVRKKLLESSFGIQGSGTLGKLSKWTDTNTLGDSLLYEDLTRVIAPDEFQALAVRVTDGTSNLLISVKDKQAIIESDVNLFLQPAGSGGTIVPKGVIEFEDIEGDKIHFFSHSYAISLDPFTFVFRSDQNFRWDTDTFSNRMYLSEEGNLTLAGNLISGTGEFDLLQFSSSLGNKIQMWENSYVIGVDEYLMYFQTDGAYEWRNFYSDPVMTLSEEGNLTLAGNINIPAGFKYKINNVDLSYSDIGAASAIHNIITSHTASGLTAGHFLKATSATQFTFAAHGLTYSDVGAPPTSRTITAGNGLTGGGDLSANRTVTLGTPDALTASTSNFVSLSSHTHAITGFALSTTTVTAGNGLTGGGDLSANRTLTLGTPGTLSSTTSNAVTTSSHTHSISGFSLDSHNHGTGTTNYITKFTNATTFGNSSITDNGTTITIPTQTLSFGSRLGQMMNLFGSVYGIGIQAYTLYQRTDADFAWFRDGIHSSNRADPGSGGVVLMILTNDNLGIKNTDPSETLDVNGNARIRSSNSMKFGGVSSTDSKFSIQYNSSEDCLDFVYLT